MREYCNVVIISTELVRPSLAGEQLVTSDKKILLVDRRAKTPSAVPEGRGKTSLGLLLLYDNIVPRTRRESGEPDCMGVEGVPILSP
jgi:hypothetical protein